MKITKYLIIATAFMLTPFSAQAISYTDLPGSDMTTTYGDSHNSVKNDSTDRNKSIEKVMLIDHGAITHL